MLFGIKEKKADFSVTISKTLDIYHDCNKEVIDNTLRERGFYDQFFKSLSLEESLMSFLVRGMFDCKDEDSKDEDDDSINRINRAAKELGLDEDE